MKKSWISACRVGECLWTKRAGMSAARSALEASELGEQSGMSKCSALMRLRK